MEKLVSIRGATSVKENTTSEIKKSVIELLTEILKQNNIETEKIVNIIFTVTHELDAIHPATVIREEFEFAMIPMLCTQEVKVKDDLPKCIRVMMQVYSTLTKEKVKHIYLNEASGLRPDLSNKT